MLINEDIYHAVTKEKDCLIPKASNSTQLKCFFFTFLFDVISKPYYVSGYRQ